MNSASRNGSVAKIIGLEVKQAWLDLRASASRLASQQGALGLAETGLSMAQSRYINGLGTQLELLDAQLVISQSEADLATAEHDRAVALVRLEQADRHALRAVAMKLTAWS